AQYELPPRPAVVTGLAPFYHGVASGDPLSDRVIIWTRVTTDSLTASVDWQMASDTLFNHIVKSGTFITDTSLDYTVKIDVTGLSPNTWYYYRFKAYGIYSMPGRTRTIPVGNVDSLRFAVFSCSTIQAGYFNAYQDIAHRNDIDAIFHLGDWYYEYLAGGTYYDGDTNRLAPLSHDSYTLSDYRLWHSQYRLDYAIRNMLQQYPLISIWDDHETCDNSWYSGAANHNPATQGNWFVRKNASKKAYFEWMPIREIAPGNDTIIHRAFKWGNLLSWIMLDTRYEARDSSLGTFLSTTNAYMIDTNRRLLGNPQLAWLQTQLNDNSTQWKMVGNQVMIAPFHVLGQVANGDQWDGYPAERNRVFRYIEKTKVKDIVFLTG
ncbi:MAG TPA: alkaline phosphatase D family protein, partial [Bacteroidia bacterium]|nr:alkaline phosphatase D family protein [Bacteroidia bacterium]